MKITKEMVHPDLRGSFRTMSVIASLMKSRLFRRGSDWLARVAMQGKDIESLDCAEKYIDSGAGKKKLRLRIYRPVGIDYPLPVMLYIHGGGYLVGFPEQSAAIIEQFITTRPCVVIAPDYRKAEAGAFPAGFDDCYDSLKWANNHAEELRIYKRRVIIAGHSAGGGLAAAVTLKARDNQDFDVAFQMPIYPMIDDLQPEDIERRMDSPVWDTGLNALGWGSYLADIRANGSEINAYAAPARNTDYKGFPPTITLVGDLEPFYRETVEYVGALRDAGIEVAFKEYPGCFHAFDMFGDGVSEDARNFTYGRFADYYDRYVTPILLRSSE